jgi:hypothetical protein
MQMSNWLQGSATFFPRWTHPPTKFALVGGNSKWGPLLKNNIFKINIKIDTNLSTFVFIIIYCI